MLEDVVEGGVLGKEVHVLVVRNNLIIYGCAYMRMQTASSF